jgi:hypothetical protein
MHDYDFGVTLQFVISSHLMPLHTRINWPALALRSIRYAYRSLAYLFGICMHFLAQPFIHAFVGYRSGSAYLSLGHQIIDYYVYPRDNRRLFMHLVIGYILKSVYL